MGSGSNLDRGTDKHCWRSMAGKRKLCLWCCRWGLITFIAAAIVVYEAGHDTWLLQRPYCAHTTSPAPTPAKCEPCSENPVCVETEFDLFSKFDIGLGRWDFSRSYKLYDYAVVGEMFKELSANSKVSLATQCSVDRITELLKIAAHWTGPISVAVFVAGEEIKWLKTFLIWLYQCKPQVFTRIAFHLVMPLDTSGVLDPVQDYKLAFSCDNIPTPKIKKSSQSLAWRLKHPYPQNHLRNLARKNCHTPYVYLVDIDIIPSKGMADALEDFFMDPPKCNLCAYVVPTYELDVRVATFPANKTELIRLARKKLAIPFHKKVFIYNQYASNFTKWESTLGNESSDVHVSHDVTNFEFLYEPFYVSTDRVPAHDERFIGYGFTRNTQVYEMFLMSYQFKVLSPIFTIHWGLQLRRSRPSWRNKQNNRNFGVFKTYQRELFARYRKDPLNLLKKPNKTNKKSS